MTLIGLLVLIVVFVVVLWLLEHYVVPLLPHPIGRVILVVVALIMVVYLLSVVGVLPAMGTRLV